VLKGDVNLTTRQPFVYISWHYSLLGLLFCVVADAVARSGLSSAVLSSTLVSPDEQIEHLYVSVATVSCAYCILFSAFLLCD